MPGTMVDQKPPPLVLRTMPPKLSLYPTMTHVGSALPPAPGGDHADATKSMLVTDSCGTCTHGGDCAKGNPASL
jgi:hypothetical protein